MKPKYKLKKSISKRSKFRQKAIQKSLIKFSRSGRSKSRTKTTFTLSKLKNGSSSRHLLKMAQNTANEQNDEPQASTSGSRDSPKRKPDRRKPFEKIKDNKHRQELIQKYKRNSGVQNFNQSILKKVVHQIKKRNFQIRNNNKSKSPSKFVRTFMGNKNGDEKVNRGETTLDDDCICIETKPEVILIDDEITAPVNVVKELELKYLKFKQYEPIGKMRMDQFNDDKYNQMITSTPNASRLNGRTHHQSRLPFHEETSSSFSSISSSTICCNNEDVTIVENSNCQNDNEIIVIEDTTVTPANRSRNRKRTKTDDSVIFVSENLGKSRQQTSSAPAFIPLNTPVEEMQIKLTPTIAKSPRPKRKRNQLFTTQDEKQLKQYNENAYNPDKETTKEQSQKRMVIIDGSNVAYQHALNKEFSVKGLKICLDYFSKMGHEVKAVVPQYRLQRQKSSDPNELDSLHREGKIVFTPCKNLPGKSSTCYDDRFILQLASELDAAIVSNDNYRDLLNENSAFKKIIENRVIGYTWCNDIFILPKDPYGKWGPTLASILNRS